MRSSRRSALLAGVMVAAVATSAGLLPSSAAHAATPPATTALHDVVPAPTLVQPARGKAFQLDRDSVIRVQHGAASVGHYLAGALRPSTGYRLPVVAAHNHRHGGHRDGITLLLSGADASLGAEGYRLDIDRRSVTIRARTSAGLFHGVQTIRQLLPPAVESATRQRGPWTLPLGRIVDTPRFAYRGAMLDVSRHFFGVDVVKRYLDQIALYKINTLHLHLSDDQGWRIAIDAWPRLTTIGGSTQVGGGPGGFFTKRQYREIVSYAASRHITIVPEIDMPGHTNAALASYAELNCNGVAPPLYTGIDVGFSSLCTTKEITYRFVSDVLRELAALTPGPYLHLGGDEASVTPPEQYRAFLNRVQPMVAGLGKKVLGWHQIGDADHSPGRVAQFWGRRGPDADLLAALDKGAKVLLSPANRSYLDMKYTADTPLGLSWAGLIEVQTAYEWNPGTHLEGVPESAVLGVEAPLWSETLLTMDHIEFMAFPRLPAIAELGWSPSSALGWEGFRTRLAKHGPRWTHMGIDFYRSPQVAWAT